jgi:uncharacterized membrane protein
VRRRLVVTQAGLLIGVGALIALLGLQRWITPLDTPLANGIVLVVQVAPLAGIAIAVIRLTPRCAFWSAFVGLIYLLHGILQIFTVEGRPFGVAETGFAVAVFVLSFMLSSQQRSLRLDT